MLSWFPPPSQELVAEGKLDKTEWPMVYQRRYPKPWWYHLKLCVNKKLMLLLRDKPYLKSQIIGAAVMGESERALNSSGLLFSRFYATHPNSVSQHAGSDCCS